MSTKKSPNPTDRYVGSRVRMKRLALGMSQEKLGIALGLTFQQVQKYEKGTNRIGASRLQQIATIMKVPVAFFFDGLPGSANPLPAGSPRFPVDDFVASHDGIRLATAFMGIGNQKSRHLIVAMAEQFAAHGGRG